MFCLVDELLVILGTTDPRSTETLEKALVDDWNAKWELRHSLSGIVLGSPADVHLSARAFPCKFRNVARALDYQKTQLRLLVSIPELPTLGD